MRVSSFSSRLTMQRKLELHAIVLEALPMESMALSAQKNQIRVTISFSPTMYILDPMIKTM